MKSAILRVIGIIVIAACIFFLGLSAGVIIQGVPQVKGKVNEAQAYMQSAEYLTKVGESRTVSEVDRDTLFEPFWETWDLLHEYYVDQPLDENAMMEGAIIGMIGSLGDPHTRYSDPESYQEEVNDTAGEYEGIGAYVDISGDYVRVSSPIKGSPAEEAGLRTNDLIVGLDGEDVTGVDPQSVQKRLLGPAGTQITLTIRREGTEDFDVLITRRAIQTPMVEGEMLENGIAYIEMSQFGDKTTDELRKTLDTLMKEDPKGLILDLRNNGGGWLTSSIECASEFLPVGELVLTERDGDGEVTEYTTIRGGGRALDVPMVVLINEGTASASEILTGALRYYERCYTIGTKSYGKGSVQIQPELSNGGAVSVTIGRWYTPDGTLVHGVGITPDEVVEITDEDYQNETDPQLDAAVNYLLSKTAGN